MSNEVLGNEKKSIKEHAESIIVNSDFYSKEEIEKTINLLWNDKRLSFNTKNNLRRKMIKYLKQNKRGKQYENMVYMGNKSPKDWNKS